MFNTRQRVDMLRQLSATTHIPPQNFFVKTDQSLRFHYTAGGAMRYLVVMRGAEAAEFLMRHGKVSHYAIDNNGSEVSMYATGYSQASAPWGQVLVKDKPIPFAWDDVDFSYNEAHMIACLAELERISKTLCSEAKPFIGKVVEMGKHFLKLAS